jgi:menaquinone-dependent protoporphyrinogen oxidase
VVNARVLVAYGSKFGSTKEIAEAVGAQLRLEGLDVEVRPADRVGSVRGYDAAVIGSSIYGGHWRRSTVRLLRREREALRTLPVWLFQSGLSVVGPGNRADPPPAVVREIAEDVGAHLPPTFAGALLPATARGPVARLMARGANGGDHRDWEAIRVWAREIAAGIEEAAVPVQHPRVRRTSS